MSGSSLDGLDIALVTFNGKHPDIDWELKCANTISLPEELKASFEHIHQTSAKKLVQLEAQFCEWISQSVLEFVEANNLKVDYIASHGHTLFHEPQNKLTYQLGNGGYIAGATGIDTVSDFRSTDIFRHGTAAPFAPIVDAHLFSGYDFYINLGGIANMTNVQGDEVVAYDISPCNQVLNYISNQVGIPFDDKGSRASQGVQNEELFTALSDVDFYRKESPKSLDNYWVQQTFFTLVDRFTCTINDKLRTVSDHIVDQLLKNILKFLNHAEQENGSTVLITGGGAYNDFLIGSLRSKLAEHAVTVVLPSSDIIEFKEAILMAYMGYLRVHNRYNVFPSVTGSSRPSVSGAIYSGQ